MKAHFLFGSLLAMASLVSASACSSSSGGDGGASPDSGTSIAKDTGGAPLDTSTTPEVSSADDCKEDPADIPAGSICIHDVTGKVTDTSGAPLGNLVVSVCGGVCYFAKTAADGTFNAHPGSHMVPDRFAVLVHGRPDKASVYSKLPKTTAEGSIALPKPIMTVGYDKTGPALPADGAGGTVTAGDVTIKAPSGTAFDLDVEDVANGDAGRLFRSTKWTASTPPDFAVGGNVLALYALAPFATRTCAVTPCTDTNLIKVAVTVANTTGLPAGTAVEFVVMGTNLFSKPPNAGVLVVEATGTVSADGATITTDAGQGLTDLSWLGIRKKS